MIKRLFSFIAWLMPLSALALDVTDLRTEDYHNPVGIDHTSIHLSWMLQSSQRAVLQTAYSVQIARDAVKPWGIHQEHAVQDFPVCLRLQS